MPKIEMGKVYKTKSGIGVRVLATDIGNSKYPVIVRLDNTGETETYTANGEYYGGSSGDWNLIEVLPKVTLWLGIEKDERWTGNDTGYAAQVLRKTKAEVKQWVSLIGEERGKNVTILPITFEPGVDVPDLEGYDSGF